MSARCFALPFVRFAVKVGSQRPVRTTICARVAHRRSSDRHRRSLGRR